MAFEIGFISFIYNAAKDLLRVLLRRFKKEDPTYIVEARLKWKSEFEKRISDSGGESGWRCRAIIRDISRLDQYPRVDEKAKGISPFFKVTLLGAYHRGILACLRIVGLKFDDIERAWRGYDHEGGETPDLNAYLVGRIPYEGIVNVDWDGDEYDRIPHVYCRFSSKSKEPYEEIVFCEKRELDHQIVYFSEIAKLEDVRRLSRTRGVELYA